MICKEEVYRSRVTGGNYLDKGEKLLLLTRRAQTTTLEPGRGSLKNRADKERSKTTL